MSRGILVCETTTAQKAGHRFFQNTTGECVWAGGEMGCLTLMSYCFYWCVIPLNAKIWRRPGCTESTNATSDMLSIHLNEWYKMDQSKMVQGGTYNNDRIRHQAILAQKTHCMLIKLKRGETIQTWKSKGEKYELYVYILFIKGQWLRIETR